MKGMQYMNSLNTANVMRQLWEKLPRYLHSKWTERVSKIRSVKGQTASFNDFCQFVSERADLALVNRWTQLTRTINGTNTKLREEEAPTL